MKNEVVKTHRIKIIAAVCAAIVMAGSTAGIYAFSSNDSKAELTEEAETKETPKQDDGIISAGGTVTASQLSDELGLKNTSVRLTVEEVLAESGDSVTAGTQLYKLTDDSIEKAKKTLDSELKLAENELIEQKTTAQADKIKAKTLYESELLLGDTAEAEYESSISELDTSLQKACDDYQTALNTTNNTPYEISQKQAEISSLEYSAECLQSDIDGAQQEVNSLERTYKDAASSYNAVLTEYNSAASVVRYLGAALGIDTSDVVLGSEASTDSQQPDIGNSDMGGDPPAFDGSDFGSFDPSQFDDDMQPSMSRAKSAPMIQPDVTEPDIQTAQSEVSSEVKALYDQAYAQYIEQKGRLDSAQKTLSAAEQEYRSASSALTELNSQLKDVQNSVTSLDKEVSSLRSTLSKAQSNLTKLRSEYNSLNSSYDILPCAGDYPCHTKVGA